MWTSHNFLLRMAPHMIIQFVHGTKMTLTPCPSTLDSTLDIFTLWIVLDVQGHVIDVPIIIIEQFQTLFPSANVRSWHVYDVFPLRIPVAGLKIKITK